MKHRTTFRFIGFMIAIIASSVILSYGLCGVVLRVSAEETAGTDRSREGREDRSQTVVVVYAVALGFIGLFSMYNALEVYKKKEEVEKEMRSIVERYRGALDRLETKEKSMTHDYREMELTRRELKINVNQEVVEISNSLQEKTTKQVSMLEEKFKGIVDELGRHQGEIKMAITEAKSEFDSFRVTMVKDFNRHYYSYTLYSLIPHYLEDSKNRIAVESAFLWLSQEGDSDDLQMLEERLSVIREDDLELSDLCSKAIDELKRKLTTRGRDFLTA